METHGLPATHQQVLILLEINVGREMRIKDCPERFLEGFYQFITVSIPSKFLNSIYIHRLHDPIDWSSGFDIDDLADNLMCLRNLVASVPHHL